MIKIPIQSFGDIITNSSSETFCIITSDEKLDEICEVLKAITDSGSYSEDNICFYRKTDNTGKECIEIDIPYDAFNYVDFIKAGVEAILDKGFKDKYNINYECFS